MEKKFWVGRLVRRPEFYLVLVVSLLCALFFSERVIAENVLLEINDSQKPAVFPIMRNMEQGQNFKVSFDVKSSEAYDLHVIPDDCVKEITVNGVSTDLQGIDGLCNFNSGFMLSQDRFAQSEKNHFEFYVRNGGGPGGLNVMVVAKKSAFASVISWLLYISIVISFVVVLCKLRVGVLAALVLTIGFVVRMYFGLALPDQNKFAYDVDGHIAYVQHIVENKAIPDAKDCWTCYHPPVYFATMAPIWTASKVFNISGTNAVQIASFAFSIAVMIFGFFVLREFLKGAPLFAATMVWALWPMLIMSATRIGNDQLFYLLHIVCLWGALKYVGTHKGKFILVSAVATLLGMWTKSTAVISLGVCGLAFVLGYVYSRDRLLPSKTELAAVVVLALTVAGILVKMFVGDGGLVSNAGSLHGGLKVGNDFINYLYVDVQQLLAQPFTSAWKDELGRQYFINYAMKTSLFGEFTLLHERFGVGVAEVVNVSFLLLLPYCVRGFWSNRMSKRTLLLFVQGVAFILALAFLRYQYPFACSNDFRYIMPSLLTLIPFAGMGLGVEKASLKWKSCGYLLMTVFALSSVVLMVMTANSL